MKQETKQILSSLKTLEKRLSEGKSSYSFKEEKFKNLQKDLNSVKKWKLSLIELNNEESDYPHYVLPYVSKMAKNLMENFLTFEAKHPYENMKGGLKLEKLTHHSFCNIPVIAGAYNKTEERTDKILFYPVEKLETEREYTFLDIKEKKDKYSIKIVKVYEDLALKKLLLYKVEKIDINKDLVNIPKNLKELDLQTIKAQATAISREEAKNKLPLKQRTAIYKEMHPVDSFELLSESKIVKEDGKIKAYLVDEEGEISVYENLYSQRPVAFTIFGVGYEKNTGWFPSAMVINVFKRKDILSKKLSPDEYLEKHTYHLNGKKLQVNYKNLYLKGIYGIDKIPTLWSYASLSANNGKLNITIPVPIQRKIKDKETNEEKWQRVKPSTIEKAVYQILKTQKITYKGEEIYLAGNRMFIEKELTEIKEPSWLKEGLKLIKDVVKTYKLLQTIKRGIDALESSVEDINQLKGLIPVHKI